MKFLIADAFTEKIFGGNPAGIVLLNPGESFPPDEIMRKTAAELRYSETAFIQQIEKTEFSLRYFTPAAEVELCGHATIAAFYALSRLGIVHTGERCTNHTLAGDLSIDIGDGFVMMEMGEAKELKTIEDECQIVELYKVMGASDAWKEFSSHKGHILPSIITTGLPDIMLPLPSRKSLNDMAPDMAALSALSEKYNVTGIHAFTLDAEKGYTAHTRNFAPLYDIDEEAATGTSSGALTYYLFLNDIIGREAKCRFLQGEAMSRPSVIMSEIDAHDDPCKIKVGGGAVILAEGEIHLP